MDYGRFFLTLAGGSIGAFMYAGPQFLLCYRNCRRNGESVIECWIEFIISMLVGVGAAIGAGQYLAAFLRQNELHQLLAVSTLVGLLANRTAPALIKLFSAQPMLQAILKSLGGKP